MNWGYFVLGFVTGILAVAIVIVIYAVWLAIDFNRKYKGGS